MLPQIRYFFFKHIKPLDLKPGFTKTVVQKVNFLHNKYSLYESILYIFTIFFSD